MTLSREQTILAELLTRLNGSALGPVSRPAGLSVDRSRMRELAPIHLPAISIYPLTADPERKGTLCEKTLTVKIVLFVKGTASVPIDQDLDPLAQWVHQQLTTDESLGGLAIRVEPAEQIWGFALHQAPFGDLDLHFNITFRHQYANPSLG
jgi:hypothetical protein